MVGRWNVINVCIALMDIRGSYPLKEIWSILALSHVSKYFKALMRYSPPILRRMGRYAQSFYINSVGVHSRVCRRTDRQGQAHGWGENNA